MGSLQGVAPQNIKLLFENQQLDIIKVLSLLQVLRNKSKKKFYKVEDIIFYYSLVNFDLITLLSEEVNDLMRDRNRYLRFNKSINQIILELSNLKYIDIKGELHSKKEKLGIRLNDKGEIFVKTFDSKYFLHLLEMYRNVTINISNNSANKNKVKGLLK